MRTRKKILISVLVVAAVAIVVAAAFFTGIIVIPRATKLTISPSGFTVESGGSIGLTARLESDSFILSGKTITWSASEGSLDKTVGETVIYTAPTVSENRSVTITISFTGDRNYLGSSATTNGLVVPPKAAPTTLSITPPMFEVMSGGTVTLTATLTPPSAPSEMITWSIDGPGTLSPGISASVTYKAPEVEENTTVTITATFPGTAEYLSSTATCAGLVLPPGVTVRKATVLTISPASFTLKPSEAVTLTATLKDVDGNILTGKAITWSLTGPGTLSSTTGASVTYTAPGEVSEKITVRITAAFAGDENYTGSSATSVGEITPVTVVGQEYVLTLDSALLKNAKIDGPITLGGIKVAKVTADAIEITGFNLSRIGLTASNVNITSLEIYATSITAYSPELGALKISGGETVSKGPYGTLTLENAIILIVRMSTKTGEFKETELVGEYVGGKEPYVPLIMDSPKVEISGGYKITGPKTYGELEYAVGLMEVGELSIESVNFKCPMEYHLDRSKNTYVSIGKWAATASTATVTNMSAYVIFIHFNAYGFVVTLSGEESPSLPLGTNIGEGGTVTDASVHFVYAELDKMAVEDFIIEVLPS